MGNVQSKKRKERPSIIRPELPADNEYSNTTATSISSILISQKQEAATQQMQHNNPFPNSIQSPPMPPTKDIDVNEDTLTSFNQMSLSSQNQLTASSAHSFGRNLDIDECINRLLEVGASGKISKSICFRNSEIVAICRAVQEVFMSQPVSVFNRYFKSC
jgi:serine/threonine-protein phosphatase PP1 catalytic subunit